MIEVDICMVVDTNVRKDSRVLKEAMSLTQAGWRVAVIGAYTDPNAHERSHTISDESGFTLLQYRVPPATNVWQRLLKLITYGLAILYRVLQYIVPLPVLLESIENTFQHTSRVLLPIGEAFSDGLSQVQAKIYHAHDYPAAVTVNLLEQPFVYDSHELYFEQWIIPGTIQRWLVKSKHNIERSIETRIAHNAEALITVSESIAQYMAKAWGLPQPLVIRNCVDLRDLQPAAHKYLEPGKRRIVHSGSLVEGRSLPELVETMRYLSNDIVLIFMGDGNLRTDLEGIAKSLNIAHKVFFVPPVSPHAVVNTLKQADIAAVTISPSTLSFNYSLPNKLFEAISAGLPVIASDTVEIAKLVTTHEIGLVCDDVSSPEKLAETIQQLLQPETYQYHKAKVEKARQRINWEQEEKSLTALYKRLLRI